MSLGLLYYLVITISDFGLLLKTVAVVTMLIWSGITVVLIGCWLNEYDEDEKNKDPLLMKLNLKRFITVMLVLLFTLPLIPSKKDMIIIAGLSLTEDTIKKTSVELGKTIPSLVELLNDEIREMKEEIKKDDNK